MKITLNDVKEWKAPPFARPSVDWRVVELSKVIKDSGGLLPGTVVIGILDEDKYVLDGRHRLDAFLQSGLLEAECDVEYCRFGTMTEMGEAFLSIVSNPLPSRAN